MENLNFEQRVKDAAKGMDIIKPDWYKHVDRAILDVRDGNRCIFAQVFGGLMVGLHTFRRGLQITPSEYYDRFMGVFASARATPLWLAEINLRLEADLSPEVSTKGDTQSDADKFLERTHEIINQPKEA